MSSEVFVSYAQNGEDVVLHRALSGVAEGRYIDVGANDPVADSVTYAFYERGWSGITVEPVPAFAVRQRAERPRDLQVEAAISDDPSGSVTLHQIADTGLSTLIDDVSDEHLTAGWLVEDITVPARRLDDVLADAGWAEDTVIHFMVVDTEGAERTVLQTLDLRRWRPWVLVVEATRPNSSEPNHDSWEEIVLSAGYRYCLFDGLSRFYVAEEHWDTLHVALSAPTNVLDRYITHAHLLREREIDRLTQDTVDLNLDRERLGAELAHARETLRRHDEENTAAILEWRRAAVRAWASAVRTDSRELERLTREIGSHINHVRVVDSELSAIRKTLSWRVTAPLRKVRGITRTAS